MDDFGVLIEEYLREVLATILRFLEEKRGTENERTTKRWPAMERVESDVGKYCDRLFGRILSRYQEEHALFIRAYSPRGTYGASRKTAEYLAAIHPFYGADLFARGIRKEWYSVVTIFDRRGNPLAAGSLDILGREIFLTEPDSIIRVTLFNDQMFKPVSPRRTTVLDANTRIAAHLVHTDYRLEWDRRTVNLQREIPDLVVWPNGGPCVFHQIVAGDLDAEVAFNEPRTEIDSGLGFVNAAELSVFSVQEDGLVIPYQFDPRKRAMRVPFFVVASTEELAMKLVRVITGKEPKLSE